MKFGETKHHASQKSIRELAPRLSKELSLLREQFLGGTVISMRGNCDDLPPEDVALSPGSSLDSALLGFQLTCITGFCNSQNYVDFLGMAMLEKEVLGYAKDNDSEMISFYNEGYLDCQGDLECLEKLLASDVFDLLNRPSSKPSAQYDLRKGGIVVLAILSQASAAASFGDNKTEIRLKKKIRWP